MMGHPRAAAVLESKSSCISVTDPLVAMKCSSGDAFVRHWGTHSRNAAGVARLWHIPTDAFCCNLLPRLSITDLQALAQASPALLLYVENYLSRLHSLDKDAASRAARIATCAMRLHALPRLTVATDVAVVAKELLLLREDWVARGVSISSSLLRIATKVCSRHLTVSFFVKQTQVV